jgi:hypothetical protein
MIASYPTDNGKNPALSQASSVAGSTGHVHHTLKCWPEFFEAIAMGRKTHDLRRSDDRKFHVGQLLCLREFDPKIGRYSGREIVVCITYITSGDLPCALSKEALSQNYCILSIRLVSASIS